MAGTSAGPPQAKSVYAANHRAADSFAVEMFLDGGGLLRGNVERGEMRPFAHQHHRGVSQRRALLMNSGNVQRMLPPKTGVTDGK